MNIKRGGAGLLLVELLLALMFFALASATCLQLFVSARQISDQSAELSRAVIEAQSIAEAFKSGADLSIAYGHYRIENSSGTSMQWTYDQDWNLTTQSTGQDIDWVLLADSTYNAVLSIVTGDSPDTDKSVYIATITVYKTDVSNSPLLQSDEPIFSLEIANVKTS